jgi:hypothetical protein
MRIALQIFTTIFLVSLVLGGLLMVAVDFKNAADIESIESNPFGQFVMTFASKDFASPAALRAAGYLWLLLALGSIVGVGAAFLKKHTFGWAVGAGLGALTLIVILVQPTVEGGNNDPKYTGMAIAFFGLIGIGLLVLLHTVLKPKEKPLSMNN